MVSRKSNPLEISLSRSSLSLSLAACLHALRDTHALSLSFPLLPSLTRRPLFLVPLSVPLSFPAAALIQVCVCAGACLLACESIGSSTHTLSLLHKPHTLALTPRVSPDLCILAP